MGAQDNAVVTALMAASLNGHEQVALVLLKAGAVLGAQNNAGMPALMIASQNGHEDSRPGLELTFSLRSTKQSGFASRALPRILVANHVSTCRCV